MKRIIKLHKKEYYIFNYIEADFLEYPYISRLRKILNLII